MGNVSRVPCAMNNYSNNSTSLILNWERKRQTEIGILSSLDCAVKEDSTSSNTKQIVLPRFGHEGAFHEQLRYTSGRHV